MYIPFHLISHSSGILVHIFQFLGMIAPLPLTGIHGLIQNSKCSQIISFMKKKISITFGIIAITFIFAAVLTSLMHVLIEDEPVYTFGMILIGILGGTYQNNLSLQQSQGSL